MKREGNIMSRLTLDLVHQAVLNASKGHMSKKEVIDFLQDKENEYEIYRQLLERKFTPVTYQYKSIISPGGKKRIVAMSSFRDRVIMHVAILMMKNKYESSLSDDCYNCVKGRGINSRSKRYDPNRRIKRIMNEKPWGYLQLDIKKCYESTKPEGLFRLHSRMFKDKEFLELLQKLSFCEIGLPIGSPTSPINQHIMMMGIDNFIRQELKMKYIRYADDLLLFGNKDELHAAKWRLKNKLWYELQYELKKDAHPTPLSVAPDILGYVYHESHTSVRKSTKHRMQKAWHKPRSRASYLGILKGANACNLTNKLNMKLSFLTTNETRVHRRMDSPLIDIAELDGQVFDILDFEVREPDKKQGKYWMRMQVRYETGGKTVTRLVKGYQEPICIYLLNLIQYTKKTAAISGMSYDEVWKATLPIQECEVENDKGWVLKGTLQKEE